MPKSAKPFNTPWRADSKTFQLTLNPSCGLSQRVCAEWKRISFYDLPEELLQYRYPRTKSAADAGALALISYLKKKQENEGSARHTATEDITVGVWVEKFTAIETSPRTGVNASKNRPYSFNTVDAYKSYFMCHIKDDSVSKLKMNEVEEEDILEYISRLSIKKLKNGKQIGGTRTFTGVIAFIRMTFNLYQRKAKRWVNPFQYIDPPKSSKKSWDALSEDEMLKLFQPGVLKDTMELAVCAAMFLSGLRRGEIAALRPEDLDWHTPKITICHAWQRFNKKDKVLGPTKGKKSRVAPFDPVLQEAIKNYGKKTDGMILFSAIKKAG